MNTPENQNTEHARPSRILIVDDDRITCATHKGILAKDYDVSTASSGVEALEMCHAEMPDLVLLDIEMPMVNGIDTCRQLREWSQVPVIFVTGYDDPEEHMQAYDAGGDDIIRKPVSADILKLKINRALAQVAETQRLKREHASLQALTQGFLSSVGQSGVLLNFMRASITCRNYRHLAKSLMASATELGVECSIMIRHKAGPTILTMHGEPSELDRSVLEKASGMGRMFQFKRRMVVNYDHVTLMVTNMPDGADSNLEAGRIRDNITILAESAEAFCDNVEMRLESMHRAEQLQIGLAGAMKAIGDLRTHYYAVLGDAGFLLQQLVDDVEKTYARLDTNQAQENAISHAMNSSAHRIMALLEGRGDFDREFAEVIEILRGGSTQNEIELF